MKITDRKWTRLLRYCMKITDRKWMSLLRHSKEYENDRLKCFRTENGLGYCSIVNSMEVKEKKMDLTTTAW